MQIIEGGVTAAKGFKAAGMAAGKGKNRRRSDTARNRLTP